MKKTIVEETIEAKVKGFGCTLSKNGHAEKLSAKDLSEAISIAKKFLLKQKSKNKFILIEASLKDEDSPFVSQLSYFGNIKGKEAIDFILLREGNPYYHKLLSEDELESQVCYHIFRGIAEDEFFGKKAFSPFIKK